MFARIIPIPPEVETVGKDVVDAALTVHKSIGPGLLECVYEECMFLRTDTQPGSAGGSSG